MGMGVWRRDRIRMKIRGQEVIGIKKGKREWGHRLGRDKGEEEKERKGKGMERGGKGESKKRMRREREKQEEKGGGKRRGRL